MVFKPTLVKDVLVEPCAREWSRNKLEALKQLNIFETVAAEKPRVVRKLPYKFSYRFVDESGKEASLMIEDWELGQLFWNCLERHEGPDRETMACNDVIRKYYNDFAKTKDLYLFLGTSLQYHRRAPNPFMVIGTFHPKHLKTNPQGSLF